MTFRQAIKAALSVLAPVEGAEVTWEHRPPSATSQGNFISRDEAGEVQMNYNHYQDLEEAAAEFAAAIAFDRAMEAIETAKMKETK